MKICGIKVTHDAAVALIDGDRLVFSHEIEKLGNNRRYAEMGDLEVVFRTLAEYGYAPSDVDRFVVDGWHNTHKSIGLFGQQVDLTLAPYRRGVQTSDMLAHYGARVLDIDYAGISHYAAHVAASYCTSPFAARGEDAFVLTWDGLMFPYVYHVTASPFTVTELGAPFRLIGNTYHSLCQDFSPFDAPIEYPATLGLAGKIMAYIATGEPREAVVAELERCATRVERRAVAALPSPDDLWNQVGLGWQVLDGVRAGFDGGGHEDGDVIASIHEFLRRRLLAGLKSVAGRSNFTHRNLCISGGAGLNIKWNSAIRASGTFDEVWVPPFPNDAGNAIGAACAEWALTSAAGAVLDWDVYCGPALLPADIPPGWSSRPLSVTGVASLLHDTGQPLVFLNGRAEAGPRSLGNRSILAAAVDPAMKALLNQTKQRESYRPVAPICLEERAPEVFAPGVADPYMVFDHEVRPEWADRVPAVCHLDGTARLQTVNREQNEVVYHLLEEYERLSGIPLLCNTSANFEGCGFFPDAASAMRWAGVDRVWSDGLLYERDS